MKAQHWHRWPLWSLIGLLLLAACSTGRSEPAVSSTSESVTVESVETEEEGESAVSEPEQVAAEEATESPTATAQVEEVPDEVAEESPEAEETAEEATEVAEENITAAENETTGDGRSDRLRRLTIRWHTNWDLHTIDYDEILPGGPPRDGIPSIDNPQFISAAEARSWLADNEPVIALELNDLARAYPLQILTWHEIVNDEIGGTPVVVTFCPLCNSALVFDSRVDGRALEFGTSGLLRHSDLIMYDRTTESLWQQFTGEAIVGDMVGQQLTFLPSSLVSFADFVAAYPDGQVLSRETGFESYAHRYGSNPYAGYDTVGRNPFLFDGELDGRLPAVERVVTVSFGNIDVAYPLRILSQVSVINDSPDGHDLVVFHKEGTSSALDTEVISLGKDVGATGVFDPHVNDQKLTFIKEGDNIVDEQTGSVWNVLGQAVAGPLAGTQLAPIVHGDHFWFSWAAFKPDTIIYGMN